MAEGTLSQAEIDKLISQKSQDGGTTTPAEIKTPPVAKESNISGEAKETVPPPLKKSGKTTGSAAPPATEEPTMSRPVDIPQKHPAPQIATRTNLSPAPAPNLEAIIAPLQTAIDSISQRVENTESAMGRINILEKNLASNTQISSQSSNQVMEKIRYLEQEMANLKNTIQTLSQEINKAFGTFDGLNNQVNEINRGLASTLGYDIRQNFTCEHCGSQGYVTGLVKCSQCEEENWWGWWPPQE